MITTPTTDPNSPAFECEAHKAQLAELAIIRDIQGGTLKLRERGKAYLPQEDAEDTGDYRVKLNRAVLFNATERARDGLVGMVFRKQLTLDNDVPVEIAGVESESSRTDGLWENIDNAGRHGDVFAQDAFDLAMRDGHCFVLVDMPPPLPAGATRADEVNAGRRPYWTLRTKDQAINWRMITINGRLMLDQITFRECSYEAEGLFGEKEVIRYRTLRRGSFAVYVEVKDSKGNVEIILESEGTTSLKEIPVAVIYGSKKENLISQPPLIDMALLNIAHYQKYADASIYLHIAARPILWFRGRDKSQKVQAIGPYVFFDVDGQNGEVAFAETTGAALGAAAADIEKIEKWMAAYGLSLLVGNKNGPETATGAILDHVAEESPLAKAARSLKDGLELALQFTARFLGLPSGGSIELGSSMAELTMAPEEMRVLLDAGDTKLPLEEVWSLLKRAGKLTDTFDPKEARKTLDDANRARTQGLLAAFDRGNVE